MPTVFRNVFGYKVFFWSNESVPKEPVHVHVAKQIGDDDVKFWILSNGKAILDITGKSPIDARDLRDIQAYLSRKGNFIIQKWEEYFGEKAAFIDKQN